MSGLGGAAGSFLLLTAFLGGCRAVDDAVTSGPPPSVAAGSALSYFRSNGITEIRYVRFASYMADAKPVRILSVGGLSPERDRETLALLDKADIGSWKTFYEDERVSDGMHWTIELVGGDKVVKRIDGCNAEPPGLRFLLKACGLDRGLPRRADPQDDE